MAWGDFVQDVNASAGGASSSVTTAGITTTTGNLIVAVAGTYNSNAFNNPTFTDNKSNTFVRAIESNDSGGGGRVVQDRKENAAGGTSHTFTGTLSIGTSIEIVVAEFEGDANTVLDQTAAGGEASAVTSHSSNATATTTAATELLIGGFSTEDSAGASLTGTNSWNFGANGYLATGESDVGLGYKQVASTGAYDFTATSAGSCRSAMCIATYKTSGGAATERHQTRHIRTGGGFF